MVQLFYFFFTQGISEVGIGSICSAQGDQKMRCELAQALIAGVMHSCVIHNFLRFDEEIYDLEMCVCVCVCWRIVASSINLVLCHENTIALAERFSLVHWFTCV